MLLCAKRVAGAIPEIALAIKFARGPDRVRVVLSASPTSERIGPDNPARTPLSGQDGGHAVRSKRVEGICPACGDSQSTIMIEQVTPDEAAALGSAGMRDIATVSCRACGYWYYRPPRVSWDPVLARTR